MARRDSQEEINKRYWKMKNDESIFDEFKKYLEVNGEGSEAVPAYYIFALNKTKGNSLYMGYNQDELLLLLKNKFQK